MRRITARPTRPSSKLASKLVGTNHVHLLDHLKRETVAEPTEAFPFRVTRDRGMGYSEDPEIAQIEGTLSVMLTPLPKDSHEQPKTSKA